MMPSSQDIGLVVLMIASAVSCTTMADDVQGTDTLGELTEQLGRRVLDANESSTMMAKFVSRQLVAPAVPRSGDEWRAGREALRNRVLDSLGIRDWIPAPWELNIRRQGTLERDGYRIEKFTFESYPGMAVPALLYVPTAMGTRMPGVVSIAGHVYGAGKAAEFLQQRNANLALRGCVVLAYDYLDCGERNTGPDARNGKPYGGGNDHGLKLFSFSTRTPTGLEVLDGIRAIDVLVARPEVDPNRIGFTGESGGGNSTYWVSAVDDRVLLSLPVSCLTTFDYWIRHDRNWDWHQRPWGVRRYVDIGGLLALHAPRPLIAISSLRETDDHEFPWEEAERSISWARQVYQHYGASDAIVHHESTTGHGYQDDKRIILYQAVERWLQPARPLGNRELPTVMESFDDLRCGLPQPNLTFRDVYEQWVRGLPEPLPSLGTGDGELQARRFLRERLGWPRLAANSVTPQPPVPELVELGRLVTNGSTYIDQQLQSEPGVLLPVKQIVPPNAKAEFVLVPGRDAAIVRKQLLEGRRVIAFDPRGTGELADRSGVLRNWAWFFGRPIPGLQAYDLCQLAFAVQQQDPTAAIHVDAPPEFGWITLLAAAASPGTFTDVRAPLPFNSLQELARAKYDSALADVPGLLQQLDVMQLKQLGR